MDWWQQFFLAPADMTSLAMFRILLGALIVANAISYRRTAADLLDPDSLLPYGVWKNGPDRRFFSLLRWLPPSSRSVTALLAVYGLAGALLCAGLATRPAAAVAFVTGISIHHRNRHALYSGDALVRVLTFLLVFSDAGQVWSIDAVLSGSTSSLGAAWPLRLMQLQVAAVYLHSFRFKLAGRTWQRGTATHFATHLLTHRRRRLPAWLDRAGVHRVATWGTLAAELAGGTLIWFEPTRTVAIAGLAALHLSLQVLMRMHLFQWTMIASLVLFVPGEAMARL